MERNRHRLRVVLQATPDPAAVAARANCTNLLRLSLQAACTSVPFSEVAWAAREPRSAKIKTDPSVLRASRSVSDRSHIARPSRLEGSHERFFDGLRRISERFLSQNAPRQNSIGMKTS